MQSVISQERLKIEIIINEVKSVKLFICLMHILYSYKITSFGNYSGKSESIGTKFIQRHIGSHDTIICKLLTPSAKPSQMAPRKPHFAKLFCQQNNASYHPVPGGRFP